MSEPPRRVTNFQRNLARTIRLTDGRPEVAGARAVPLDVFGAVHALSGALDPHLRPQTVDYPNGVLWPWERGCFIALSPTPITRSKPGSIASGICWIKFHIET